MCRECDFRRSWNELCAKWEAWLPDKKEIMGLMDKGTGYALGCKLKMKDIEGIASKIARRLGKG
jgi:hypothetical protein